jgi:hypothetical protein
MRLGLVTLIGMPASLAPSAVTRCRYMKVPVAPAIAVHIAP